MHESASTLCARVAFALFAAGVPAMNQAARADATLVLAEAGTAAYVELARARVLQGRDAWAPMALVGGRLLLRNSKELICLDVAAL